MLLVTDAHDRFALDDVHDLIAGVLFLGPAVLARAIVMTAV
jgi:hypothetical protein